MMIKIGAGVTIETYCMHVQNNLNVTRLQEYCQTWSKSTLRKWSNIFKSSLDFDGL